MDKVRAGGGSAVWIEDKGLVHAHLRARHSVKRARDSFDRVLRVIAMMGAGTAIDDTPLS